MLEQDSCTGEMEKREVVLCEAIPAHDQATGVMKPGEETFDLPPTFLSPQRATVLGGRSPAVVAIARDQIDTPRGQQHLIQRIAVVRFVADQAGREIGEESI